MSAQQKRFFRRAGRYLILESLGAGSTGEVYRAFDPLINRAVAIKVLRLDVLETAPARSFIDRFYHEARIVGTLSHPHIITLFDAGQTESQLPFLAFEYADGPTIMERIGTGESFSTQETLHLLSQIAAALDYAHGLGVIHRDIKPSNLIIHRGKDVKITDFGIAKLVQAERIEEPAGAVARGTQFTHGGSLLGTPSYMSPEQAQGLPLDGRSDVFSLAVVAFEMLSGKLPFVGSSISATLYRLVHHEPEHPSGLERLGLHPKRWRDVFSRALAKDPTDRFSTATALVDAINSLSSSASPVAVGTALRTTSSAAEPVPPTTTLPFAAPGSLPAEAKTIPRAGQSGRRRWLSSALIGVVLLGSGLRLELRRSGQPTPPSVELVVPEPPAFEVVPPVESEAAPQPRRPARVSPRPPAAPKPAPPAAAGATEPARTANKAAVETPPFSDEVDVPARRREGQEVRYPEIAKKDGIVGRVEVSFLITENGEVRDVVVVVSTGSVLDQAVVDAVRSWKYLPARKNGLPVAVRQRYRHEFRKPS